MSLMDGVPGPPESAPANEPASSAAPGFAPPRSSGERRRRSRHRSDDRERARGGRRPIRRLIGRVLMGLLGLLSLVAVFWMRWWIVAVVAGVIAALSVIFLLRSRKRHPHVPWVRVTALGGLIASLTVIGSYVAVHLGAPQLQEDPVLQTQRVEIPFHFEETLGEMRLLVLLFTAATLGGVLLAVSLKPRRRSSSK